MDSSYFKGNRQRLYEMLENNSLLVLFSGREVRKTNDEFYPFYTQRSFLYLTGLDGPELILLAAKDASGTVSEKVFLQPADPMIERWNGRRIKADEAVAIGGLDAVDYAANFPGTLHRMATSGRYEHIYLDLFRQDPADRDTPSHLLLQRLGSDYPYLQVKNADALIRKLRLIKQPCEIEAIRHAEKITAEGITAMMKGSRPGMYEYQYKALWDFALAQHGPQGSAFPSIISAGQNNFCIHYHSYTGQALDGDMVLNDVGAWWDNLMTDVSRGWPCNGRFSPRQKLLYQCALATSNHMFETIRPGMKMADVDGGIRAFNAQCLVDAGVLDKPEHIGKYMWHGGAHHVGYDVHDVVETPEIVAPGMVFCVDVGIYHEEWGIGFRLEDNCIVTEDGCENLSVCTPRTIEQIEDTMRSGVHPVS